MERSVKIISALLLAVCFLLPMKSCQRKAAIDSSALHEKFQATTESIRPYELVNLTEPLTWLIALSYFWPALYLIATAIRKRTRRLLLMEFFLAVASIVYILAITGDGTRRYGTYMALCALILFPLPSVAVRITEARRKRPNQAL